MVGIMQQARIWIKENSPRLFKGDAMLFLIESALVFIPYKMYIGHQQNVYTISIDVNPFARKEFSASGIRVGGKSRPARGRAAG
jgi:hypothetical protein